MVGFERMKKVLALVLALIFTHALSAGATAPATCTISGVLYDGAGNPVPNATIYFNSRSTQVVNGNAINPVLKTSSTDANGNLSSTALVQALFIQITICQAQGGGCSAPTTGYVPVASSTTFANLLAGQAVATVTTLSGNLNASGFRIYNLGTNTTLADALSQGQSSLNNLAAPTGNYPMVGYKLTGLPAGTGSGDSLAFGLNHLNDLTTATGSYAMGSNKITGLAAPTATGDALSEGRSIGATTPAAGTFTTLTGTNTDTSTLATGTFFANDFAGGSQSYNEASGGTFTPVIVVGMDVFINLTDNGGWTLANPTFPIGSIPGAFHWYIRIYNTSGNTAGTITLGTGYRTDSSWSTTGPADGKTRICPVYSIGGPVNHIGPCTGDETN